MFEGREPTGRRGVDPTEDEKTMRRPDQGCEEQTAGLAATEAQVFAGRIFVKGAHGGGPEQGPTWRSSGGGAECTFKGEGANDTTCLFDLIVVVVILHVKFEAGDEAKFRRHCKQESFTNSNIADGLQS
ncbi:hypothetical protein CDAR_617751 [Caerostris darwini]|uniref:Uncharacterized protein n=1 Tax=Caerostris darwini TaxID=1538125 RepID=A0AAV4RTD4_9ARAC|nr:hypothetical protein CDAR_617751 [Caerostris darwini]